MFLDELVNSRRRGVVAAEAAGDEAVFFYHDGGGFRKETVPFSPMLLLSAPEQLEDFPGTAAVSPLAGGMTYRFLARFPSAEEYDRAVAFLRKNDRGPYSLFRDLPHHLLQQEETRLFAGM